MLEALEGRILLSRTWFVAPNGQDSNPGTILEPFRTIQHAALEAEPGDTVYLRAGTYHETVTPLRSGTSTAPITYSAYANEVVTIDGADPIAGWVKDANSKTTYSAPDSANLGIGNNQVFVNGQAMNEASWPYTPVGAIQPVTAKIASVYTSAIGAGQYFADTVTIAAANLPGGPGAWDGATIHYGFGQNWTIQTGTVVNSGNGTITIAYLHQTNWESPEVGNTFYLTGKMLGLTAAGEWFRDPTSGRLYLWDSAGTNPASAVVEVKDRIYGFELSGLSYVDIRNINLFACSIDTNSLSSHNIFSGITASYVSQQMLNPLGWINNAATTGILLRGSNNVLENTSIMYSSGNGVFIGGQDNTVEDCTIVDTDYSGTDEAAITITGSDQLVQSNVIHDTGRDGILDSNSTSDRILQNTIYDIGHQITDVGAIYDYGTNSLGTVIAYNTIWNVTGGGFGGGGVYCDNGSAGYVIYDNTISACNIPLKLNPPCYNITATNNTINGKLVANSSSPKGNIPTFAQSYKGSLANLTTLGTLGGYKSTGLGINNAGEVVGAAYAAAAIPAYVYENGKEVEINAFNTGQGEATAINSAGVVVGSGYSSRYPIAFIDSNGSVKSLGTLDGDVESQANAINSAGQVVGVSFGLSGEGHAFLYSGGVMRYLGTLGGSISEPFGINTAGTIVGESTVAGDRDAHAFAYYSSQMHDLGTLGGSSSYATAINTSGEIVGASLTAGNAGFHAFLDISGKMTDLGTLPGYTNTVATAIDSNGDIVGYAYNKDTSVPHAFLWRNGKMIDLNTLLPANTTWKLENATGINDKNQIVGTATQADGVRTQAYILTLPG